MSLLLLQDADALYVARNAAGAVLPLATLTVYVSGTTELAVPVVVADSAGEFEAINLDAGEYRIEMHTAAGVLVWSVDPFTCDCGAPVAIPFRTPINQALDVDGVPYPGATLTFTDAGTGDPLDTYADTALTRPWPNPLTANAGGWFPPVYLDDAESYRVVLADAEGNELGDFDPYVCDCSGEPPPVAPVIDELDPPSVVEDTGAFTLTVIGENFIASSVVRWEGADRATTYVSATELEAAILSGDVDDVGEFDVTVFNDDGGGLSNAEPFEVESVPIAYATLDPATHNADIVLSGGNLIATRQSSNTGNWRSVRATIGKSSGKWYFEYTYDVAHPDINNMVHGVAAAALSQTGFVGSDATSYGWQDPTSLTPLKWNNGSFTGWGSGFVTLGSVLRIALDMDNGDMWFGIDNTWINGGDPETGFMPAFSGLSGTIFPALSLLTTGGQMTANFGPTMAFAVPVGFNAGLYP